MIAVADQPTSIGPGMRMLRVSVSVTQAEMAKRLGVSRSTVSAWERSTSVPTRGAVIAWLLACGHDPVEARLMSDGQVVVTSEALVASRVAPTRGGVRDSTSGGLLSTTRTAFPGEACTCGRQAIYMRLTERFGWVGSCGTEDGAEPNTFNLDGSLRGARHGTDGVAGAVR
jgi:transcriptional regulator with XRE-family HTH domain